MKKIILCIALQFIIADKLPNDVRWVRESNEYKSLCYQIYSNATTNLNRQVGANPYSLNNKDLSTYAIVMDLDETVLDNSQYQVELLDKNESFNMTSWAKWVNREEAKLVPGAKEYIDVVRSYGIQLIFISNRMDERLNATINNMKILDIYSESDIFLLRKNKKDKKTVRRNEIYNSTGRMANYNTYIVIQYLGDAMGDFPSYDSKQFSIDQYIFPNPMYGKW
tara:strand:+ start:322 stop:990 length:669 start_codon:yes stop_codon:yes gene_type:complete